MNCECALTTVAAVAAAAAVDNDDDDDDVNVDNIGHINDVGGMRHAFMARWAALCCDAAVCVVHIR